MRRVPKGLNLTRLDSPAGAQMNYVLFSSSQLGLDGPVTFWIESTDYLKQLSASDPISLLKDYKNEINPIFFCHHGYYI